jgi:KRAB domain-containing zinc finger protein
MSETSVETATPVAEKTQTLKRKLQDAEPTVDEDIVEKKQKTAVHKCSKCERQFETEKLLKKHSRGIHKGVYPCKHCHKSFKTTRGLNRHERIHTGETPFECLICKKCFAQKGALVVHARVHTGDKPYKCSKCEECFTVSPSMHRHMREQHSEQHNEPTKKKFMCGNCGLLFAREGGLTRHLKTHVDKDGNPIRVECKVEGCDEVSTSNKSVKEHRASHSNIRCSECDKGFSKKSNLTKHMNKFHG